MQKRCFPFLRPRRDDVRGGGDIQERDAEGLADSRTNVSRLSRPWSELSERVSRAIKMEEGEEITEDDEAECDEEEDEEDAEEYD